ncbi:hypothetical protein CYLTODRAFT_397741 [Cylindrobasidium torrendii FP15055 ss-10]|uniref:UspA domain-containing protein n=1 Tax=Cylindrobasidium torrendii FP15055 ss-10 TaxID=1314674 RepID=A0A0D7BAE3_9AGAR|nr:hypothetical protein CYLTODRAFT_397741 [Cylindrobasidium torrendii FP15055 ss-10]
MSNRRSWISKLGSSSRPSSSSGLPTPTEGRTLDFSSPLSRTTSVPSSSPQPDTLSRTNTREDKHPYVASSVPSTPRRNRSVTSFREADPAHQEPLPHTPLERTETQETTRSSGFPRMSLASMMSGISLSLSRTNTREDPGTPDDKERGRSFFGGRSGRSSSHAPPELDPPSRSQSRARSQSPFTFRRFKAREPSPPPEAVRLGDDSDWEPDTPSMRPRNAFSDADDSPDEVAGEETDGDEWTDDELDIFDPETEHNTEANAFTDPVIGESLLLAESDEFDHDPLGEGVNVIIPPEPYFPSTLNTRISRSNTKRNPRRRKSVKTDEPLPLQTSRPIFQRDRCTIKVVQGNPDEALGGRRRRRYVVASDLSEEARYAVEWGIGTVLRDGDEMLVVTVVENDSKVDPPIPNTMDRAQKLRSQQERQGLAYILVRQVTGLLQRTKLNVSVSCQSWHAKNSRHMLLDIVDYNEPVMLIVGSRGVGQLKGILLGSTSHYLIQKCSVPVMVARRRLKRPPKRSAHLLKNRAHVKLAEAGIDRVAAKVDQDVKVMRDEIQRDDDRRAAEAGGIDRVSMGSRTSSKHIEEADAEAEADGEGDDETDEIDDAPAGVKVAGS